MSQVIDNATRALSQTGVQVQKLLIGLPAAVEGLIADIQANANTIADQESAIAENTKRIESEVRDQAAEIRLRVKEDSRVVLEQLLNADQLSYISRQDLNDLRTKLDDAIEAAQVTEFKAVKSAESALHAKYGAEISNLKSDNKVELATFTANSQRDAELIAGLRAQVAQLEATITANREAETERTKALAQPNVTVNNGKQ